MSAKLVVTLLATSLLTVGCVAYTDDPYYRGGYGYHDHDDDRYDRSRQIDSRQYDDRRRQLEDRRRRLDERQRQLDDDRRRLEEDERRLEDDYDRG